MPRTSLGQERPVSQTTSSSDRHNDKPEEEHDSGRDNDPFQIALRCVRRTRWLERWVRSGLSQVAALRLSVPCASQRASRVRLAVLKCSAPCPRASGYTSSGRFAPCGRDSQIRWWSCASFPRPARCRSRGKRPASHRPSRRIYRIAAGPFVVNSWCGRRGNPLRWQSLFCLSVRDAP